MNQEWLITIIGSIGAAAGAVLTKALEKLLGRADKQHDHEAQWRLELRADIADLKKRLHEVEERNDRLIVENSELRGKVLVLENQRDGLLKRVTELEAHVARLESRT